MSEANAPRMAVVGCGPWGRNLARAFAKVGALECLVDVSPVLASRLADDILADGYPLPAVRS
jgi:predicted dehydrogenase